MPVVDGGWGLQAVLQNGRPLVATSATEAGFVISGEASDQRREGVEMATKCWRCQGSGRIFDKVDGKYQQVPCPVCKPDGT